MFTINDAIYKTRGKNDECYTPLDFVREAVRFIPKEWVCWCPFDTAESNWVIGLREAGHKVIHSHIDEGKDFFVYEPEAHYDCIVSNPPFTGKRQVFETASRLGKPFMLLMTATWLNDAAPIQLYLSHNARMQLIHPIHRVRFLGKGHTIPFKSILFCTGLPLPSDNTLIYY